MRHFTDWVHAAYLSALPFLGALLNAVISVCLGSAKEWGEKLKFLRFSGIYVPTVTLAQ